MASITVTPGSPAFSPLKVHHHAALLCGLFDRARDKLTDEELHSLTTCGEPVRQMLEGIESLCNGLACLIKADAHGPGAGNFQSHHDVPDLLLTVASVAEYAGALLDLADAADAVESPRDLTGEPPNGAAP